VIVDTSALVAVHLRESGWERLRDALAEDEALIPAPVIVEFNLVTSLAGNDPDPDAGILLSRFLTRSCRVCPFSDEDAALSAEAHRLHGRGNGRGGKLNMLDVMIYCMAKRLGRPILCTGRDFAATDALLHPASRAW
jgi:ribonuclease VapC